VAIPAQYPFEGPTVLFRGREVRFVMGDAAKKTNAGPTARWLRRCRYRVIAASEIWGDTEVKRGAAKSLATLGAARGMDARAEHCGRGVGHAWYVFRGISSVVSIGIASVV